MIEGFCSLLQYLEQTDGVIAIIARKINQDSLESLFGHLRHICGGGRDPNMMKVVHGIPAVEEKRAAIRRSAQHRRNTNSGQSGSEVHRSQGSSWLAGHVISMNDNEFTLCCVHARGNPSVTVPVRWQTLREFQAKDELRQRTLGLPKHMPWLTAPLYT